jgi:transcriptional regulator with XRE-family HTH domain
MKIGDRIRDVMRERKITVTELAHRMGVAQSTLSEMLSGNPTEKTMIKISKAIGCSLFDFMTPPDDPRERGAVPVYKTVRCGDGQDGKGVSGEIVDEIPFDHETVRSGVFGIIATGDSMWGPPAWIQDGFVVLFEPWAEHDIPVGRIACCTIGGHGDPVCKRLRREPDGRVVLASDNPGYPPIFMEPGQSLTVHGVWFATLNRAPNGHRVREEPAPYGVKKKEK